MGVRGAAREVERSGKAQEDGVPARSLWQKARQGIGDHTKLDVAGSEMVSRSIAKDLSWTTWESSARRLKSRIWTCAARAEPCRRPWSIRGASTPGFHAECSRTSAFARSEHKHSKSRTDVASSGTSDMLWCAPEEWKRPISLCSRNRET